MRAIRFPTLRTSHRSRTAPHDGIQLARGGVEGTLQSLDNSQHGRRDRRGGRNLDSLFGSTHQRRILRLRRAVATLATDGYTTRVPQQGLPPVPSAVLGIRVAENRD